MHALGLHCSVCQLEEIEHLYKIECSGPGPEHRSLGNITQAGVQCLLVCWPDEAVGPPARGDGSMHAQPSASVAPSPAGSLRMVSFAAPCTPPYPALASRSSPVQPWPLVLYASLPSRLFPHPLPAASLPLTAPLRYRHNLQACSKAPALLPVEPFPRWAFPKLVVLKLYRKENRTSLIVQWLRICQPTPGTQVQL